MRITYVFIILQRNQSNHRWRRQRKFLISTSSGNKLSNLQNSERQAEKINLTGNVQILSVN